MKHRIQYIPVILAMLLLASCMPPQQEKPVPTPVKNNYIILLDLSDRLIVQDNQSERDKELIKHIYNIFEDRVRSQLYLRSRDEIRVVIAPQRGAGLQSEIYEDSLYTNMDNIPGVLRRKSEEKRRNTFYNNLDKLYDKGRIQQKSERFLWSRYLALFL